MRDGMLQDFYQRMQKHSASFYHFLIVNLKWCKSTLKLSSLHEENLLPTIARIHVNILIIIMTTLIIPKKENPVSSAHIPNTPPKLASLSEKLYLESRTVMSTSEEGYCK